VEKVLPTAGTIFRVPELGAKVFTQLRDESTDTVRERIQEYADTQAVAAVRAALHLLSDRPIMPSCLIEAGLLLPRSRFRLRPKGVQREQEAPPKAELREFVDSGPARKLVALQGSRDKKKALKKKNRSDELAARAHTVSATVVAPTRAVTTDPRTQSKIRYGLFVTIRHQKRPRSRKDDEMAAYGDLARTSVE